jgi:hypothetical protein
MSGNFYENNQKIGETEVGFIRPVFQSVWLRHSANRYRFR